MMVLKVTVSGVTVSGAIFDFISSNNSSERCTWSLRSHTLPASPPPRQSLSQSLSESASLFFVLHRPCLTEILLALPIGLRVAELPNLTNRNPARRF